MIEEACRCTDRALRYRSGARGRRYFWQCRRCGGLERVAKERLAYHLVRHGEPVDEGLIEARAKAVKQVRRQAKEAEGREWLAGYSEYLGSEVWRGKRARVLERDGGVCQACLARPATEVHHLTYDHVFREPLFELTSVCGACHLDLTTLDRERRRRGR